MTRNKKGLRDVSGSRRCV